MTLAEQRDYAELRAQEWATRLGRRFRVVLRRRADGSRFYTVRPGGPLPVLGVPLGRRVSGSAWEYTRADTE